MATERYPMNPSGSPGGVAALCSEDGRHLALMPHPERCFLSWQMPWQDPEYVEQRLREAEKGARRRRGRQRQIHGGGGGSGEATEKEQDDEGLEASPWMQLFHNAYKFCTETDGARPAGGADAGG
ncbi:unnamed protein product [Phaeothamnion confervicola]